LRIVVSILGWAELAEPDDAAIAGQHQHTAAECDT
jgi:hypothetical protein